MVQSPHKPPWPLPGTDEPSYEEIKQRNADMLEDLKDAREIVYQYGSRIPSLCEAIILLDSAIAIGKGERLES